MNISIFFGNDLMPLLNCQRLLFQLIKKTEKEKVSQGVFQKRVIVFVPVATEHLTDALVATAPATVAMPRSPVEDKKHALALLSLSPSFFPRRETLNLNGAMAET